MNGVYIYLRINDVHTQIQPLVDVRYLLLRVSTANVRRGAELLMLHLRCECWRKGEQEEEWPPRT
jgi:hypothetical protein